MQLEKSSPAQVATYFKENDLVIIPVGSQESHGSHLALGTDAAIPTHIAKELEKVLAGKMELLVVPTVPYGVADSHLNFPGSISLGFDGLYLVLTRIVGSLWNYGARRFVFLNGHGGNDSVFGQLGLEIHKNGGVSCHLNWWQISGQLNPVWRGGHGDAQETAAMMIACPEGVFLDKVVDFSPAPLAPELHSVGPGSVSFEEIPIMIPRNLDCYAPDGWCGPLHPSTANQAWGKEMLERVTLYFADFLQAYVKIPCNKEKEGATWRN